MKNIPKKVLHTSRLGDRPAGSFSALNFRALPKEEIKKFTRTILPSPERQVSGSPIRFKLHSQKQQ
jgi:hypothetical protein